MKPLILTPCERVLLDPQQGQSLINVFHGSKMQVPEDQEVPENAAIPRDWAIFSKWDLDPNEEGVDYTSTVEVYWPDGNPFAVSAITATQPTVFGMAFVHRMNAFPIGQNGSLRIVVSIKTADALVYGPVEIRINVGTIEVKPEELNARS